MPGVVLAAASFMYRHGTTRYSPLRGSTVGRGLYKLMKYYIVAYISLFPGFRNIAVGVEHETVNAYLNMVYIVRLLGLGAEGFAMNSMGREAVAA